MSKDNPSFTAEINASFPVGVKGYSSSAAYSADAIAMLLVGERHSKRDLVDLVRWLILDEAKTVRTVATDGHVFRP